MVQLPITVLPRTNRALKDTSSRCRSTDRHVLVELRGVVQAALRRIQVVDGEWLLPDHDADKRRRRRETSGDAASVKDV